MHLRLRCMMMTACWHACSHCLAAQSPTTTNKVREGCLRLQQVSGKAVSRDQVHSALQHKQQPSFGPLHIQQPALTCCLSSGCTHKHLMYYTSQRS
jgi:hypothetical protein